jgi:excalibur calcium-binding domain-containing protein
MASTARQPLLPSLTFILFAAALSLTPASAGAAVRDRDCSDFRTQRQAQVFFESHGPGRDRHRLDGDRDGFACEALPCPCRARRFDNGEWTIARGAANIPEDPFRVRVDDVAIGKARLLTFANRVGRSDRFPQVLVISSSGYLRLKAGADPSPPLPFGQSLVLGPAVFGSSASFPASTLFFNPQVQQVNVDTSKLRRSGKGTLVIEVIARDRSLPPTDTHANQVMNLTWKMTLAEPTKAKTRLRVDGGFRFTEAVVPDPVRTSELQSFRLVQVSSMFIDGARHDVDGFRYPSYNPGQANALLPGSPSPLSAGAPILDSLHGDDLGAPNGDTPSYRIRIQEAAGPLSGPLYPRAYFNDSQDLNDDNLGLWIHRQPLAAIPAGASGRIRFGLTATADPLPAP